MELVIRYKLITNSVTGNIYKLYNTKNVDVYGYLHLWNE